MQPTTLSIIMPLHVSSEQAAQALATAANAEPDQLIVVVDGADLDAIALARRWATCVIPLACQGGPAVARNVGARAAQGELLFFVDSDVVISAETLPHIRHAFTEPTLAALIGSYDAHPADPAFLSQYRNLLHHFTHQQSGGAAFTFWGACGAIRRTVFLQVGGFDEGYPHPSIEDIELGSRLRRAGYRIALDPTLQVTHLKKWTAGNMLHTDLLRRALPWSRLILAGDGFEESLNIDRSQRLSVALAFLLLPLLMLSRRGSVVTMSGLLWLNRAFYRFLWRERGGKFTLIAIFWHWVYFLCSGLGFLFAFVERRLGVRKP